MLTISSLTPEELHSTLFWPSPLSFKFLIIQVSYHPSLLLSKSLIIQVPPSNKSFLKQTFPLFTNLGFSFPVLSPSWKVVLLTISTLYNLLVFLPILFISWDVFYRLIFCPVFFLSLPIIGLGGFLPAIWSLGTHQLPYKAKMFSVVSWFSSLVSLIGLGGFSPAFHPISPLTISRSAKLVSKEGGNCNNVTFEAESFRSKSHMTTINHNFTSSSLTSIMALDSSSSTPQSRR